MRSVIRPAIVLFILMTLITGVLYPLSVSAVALAFPTQATGSVIQRGDKATGSMLIAQPFTDAKYFWPRPSAANYDASAGAGSNLGPTNPALVDAVKSRIDALHAADPANNTPVPIDLVTASGSGLDPHISVAAANYQVGRVAQAHGLSTDAVRAMVKQATEAPVIGLFGAERVNVLALNLKLDEAPHSVATTRLDGDLGFRARGFLPQ